MNDQFPVSTLRLALVVAGLVISLIAGFGIGRLNPHPSTAAGLSTAVDTDHSHPPGTLAHEHPDSATTEVGGLAVTSAGYTLAPLGGTFTAGRADEFRFQIRDLGQRPVTRFAIVHDKPLHLIVVRRDLTGYQHLHPTMAADGTWSVPLTLPEPGIWRAYADFTALTADGSQTAVTLGVDLVAPGAYTPRELPPAARTATVDRFTVDFQGDPRIGVNAPLAFRVRVGDSTPTLERYLGAYGHLVVLREGDLGYLHVHPETELAGNAVMFRLTVPGPGRYRFYLDFQVAGEVHTAEYTVTMP
ncbi:hypothetical protein GA0074692_5884 [Micromonospora pallida]|uniref:Secreted protein n=1 Tax=Micromonospora pallida TaxID=145854 RepID=A0A1C6TFQ7_9ACTN|nr:hypothetical protein [Micromonospora pallida]SCL40606.1 hypothetical protein GA0074692_5884 [Micromonospora pallida]